MVPFQKYLANFGERTPILSHQHLSNFASRTSEIQFYSIKRIIWLTLKIFDTVPQFLTINQIVLSPKNQRLSVLTRQQKLNPVARSWDWTNAWRTTVHSVSMSSQLFYYLYPVKENWGLRDHVACRPDRRRSMMPSKPTTKFPQSQSVDLVCLPMGPSHVLIQPGYPSVPFAPFPCDIKCSHSLRQPYHQTDVLKAKSLISRIQSITRLGGGQNLTGHWTSTLNPTLVKSTVWRVTTIMFIDATQTLLVYRHRHLPSSNENVPDPRRVGASAAVTTFERESDVAAGLLLFTRSCCRRSTKWWLGMLGFLLKHENISN